MDTMAPSPLESMLADPLLEFQCDRGIDPPILHGDNAQPLFIFGAQFHRHTRDPVRLWAYPAKLTNW